MSDTIEFTVALEMFTITPQPVAEYEASYCTLDCSKCGGTVLKFEDGVTLGSLLMRAANHECLPEIRKGFA